MITFTRKKGASQVKAKLKPAAVYTGKQDASARVEEGRHSTAVPQLGSTTAHQCKGDGVSFRKAAHAPPTQTVGKHSRPADDLPELLRTSQTNHHTSSIKRSQVDMQGIISANVLPVAPVTASNKPAARARAGQTITPITDPGSFSNKAESSSDHSASWSTPCSSDASSYQPSSNHSADDKDAEPCLLAAKPPLLPKKTIVKPGSDLDKAKVKLLQQPEAVLAAANAAAHTIKYKGLSALEAQHITKNQLKPDETEDEIPQAAKRQRINKVILQEADLHVSSAAVRAAANNDRIVVEMPAAFDVAGDAGSIGRFALQPNSGSEGIYIDIKGTAYDARSVSCSSSLLLVKLVNAGVGGGAATIEMVTNTYVRADPQEGVADDADCTKEWSEEENDFQEPSAAPCSKAKAVKPKPKAKRKLQTKPAAKKK